MQGTAQMTQNGCLCLLTALVYLLCAPHVCHGQICKFYNLDADCYYRVDGIAMVNIRAAINQCRDPVDVTFSLKCDTPSVKVDWSHTYSTSSSVSVQGFLDPVELKVDIYMKDNNIFVIDADFIVKGLAKADFIQEEIKLNTLDQCTTLNRSGIIAIGIMGALFVIAAILLVIVLVIWRRRNKFQSTNDVLVENSEFPSWTTHQDAASTNPGGVNINTVTEEACYHTGSDNMIGVDNPALELDEDDGGFRTHQSSTHQQENHTSVPPSDV